MHSNIDFPDSSRFYLFLLVHAAYVDYHLHSKEVQFILNKLKEMLPDKMDIYDEFLELKDQYEKLGNREIDILIKENYPRFVESETRQELLTWLSGLIKADGIVRQSEMDFLVKVRSIIEDPVIH